MELAEVGWDEGRVGGGETTAGSVPISSSRLYGNKKNCYSFFKIIHDFSLLNVNLGKIFKLLF